MDLLFLNYDRTGACAFYRSSGIIKDLKKKTGHNIDSVSWRDVDVNWAMINNYDIIMFQRPYGKPALELCQYIKDCGVALWCDYDDNLLCIPEDNKASATYGSKEIQDSIKAILKLADVITVTTEPLRDSYNEFNNNIEVIPNAFNDTIFNRGILPPRKKIALWRGSDTHQLDLLAYGAPVNQSINEFPEWLFYFIGFNPWVLNIIDNSLPAKNKGYMKDMDIIQYFHTVMKIAPSVLHVPLNDSLFNRCKSDIAFLESAYFGAICICPHWWQIPGTIPYTSPDSYYEALKSVITGQVDIEVNNRIAWEYIQDNLRLSQVNVKRVEIINSLR
jgi:hypothetical protein